MKRIGCLLGAFALVAGGCGNAGAGSVASLSVTLLFAGDLMLGRSVEPVAAADPVGMFEDVRFVIRSADLAAANLESPLTDRPHLDPAVHALEADPGLAALIGGAGFDVLGVANNHTGDAGPAGLVDTMQAVTGAGLVAVGWGVDEASAAEPVIVERDGIRVAYLAFDATGLGPAAGAIPGIAAWDAGQAEEAVRDARRLADIVTVAVHGGIEYLSRTDTYLEGIADQLAGWGADVVWGHGPHVVQPVWTIETGERTTVVATSLGNFLFDQQMPGTTRGALLEVLVASDGVRAYRVGSVEHEDLRVHFEGWADPVGDAVLFGATWWNLVSGPAELDETGAGIPDGFAGGEVMAHGIGDVTRDGGRELVVSFRRPFGETLVNRAHPEVAWSDAGGRSAHLGVYRLDSLESVWVAGSLPRPATALAVCDGSVALGFVSPEDGRVLVSGAWVWDGFGFWYSAELIGSAAPGCVDVDGDGHTEPAVLGRRQ